MMMGGKPVRDVLGKKSMMDDMADEEESSDESSYDAFAGELKDILGLDDEKAKRLRDVICGLAREEMEGGDEGVDEDSSPRKPGGVAIVLGVGKGKNG